MNERSKLIKDQKKRERLKLVLIIAFFVIIDFSYGYYYKWDKSLFMVFIISILLIGFIHIHRPRKCIICGTKMTRSVTQNDFVIFKCENCDNIINTGIGLEGNPS